MFDLPQLAAGPHATAPATLVDSTDTELLDTIRTLAATRRHLDITEAATLAELHTRGTCDRLFGMTTQAWVAYETATPAAHTKSRCNTGLKLRTHFETVQQAVLEGTISFEHAAVICRAANPRIINDFAAIQDQMINMAQGTVFNRWKQQINALANLIDQDGGHNPNDDLNTNQLYLNTNFDGTTQLNATFTGGIAETLIQTIDRVADELFRQYANDNNYLIPPAPIPPRATLRALAFIEICRRANASETYAEANNTNGEPCSDSSVTSSSEESSEANPHSNGPTTGTGGLRKSRLYSRPTRPEITLVINAAEPHRVYTPRGLELTDSYTQALCCDTDLYPIVVNSLGVPLNMGRKIRSANTHQRRALALRDGSCVFPGCEAQPTNTDAHHITQWTKDLGETNVETMALFCRHHHGIIHRTGWNIRINRNGHITITTPTGQQLPGQQHHQIKPNPPDTT